MPRPYLQTVHQTLGGADRLQRVFQNVPVVFLRLADAAQEVQLGDDHREQPQAVQQAQVLARLWRTQDLDDLFQHPLARGLGGQGAMATNQRLGVRLDREAQLGDEAHGAQQAQGIVQEDAVVHGPDEAGAQIGQAARDRGWSVVRGP